MTGCPIFFPMWNIWKPFQIFALTSIYINDFRSVGVVVGSVEIYLIKGSLMFGIDSWYCATKCKFFLSSLFIVCSSIDSLFVNTASDNDRLLLVSLILLHIILKQKSVVNFSVRSKPWIWWKGKEVFIVCFTLNIKREL